MKPYTVNLAAGVALPLDIGGMLFVVDTAPGAFRVDFFGATGTRRDEFLDAAQPADFAQPENGFGKILLTSPTTQTVKFYVSRGRTGRNVFTGTVAGSLGTLQQLAIGGVNSLVTTERGFSYGASFGSITAIGAAANEVALAPASNVNGVIVWDAEIADLSSTAANLITTGLIAKSSAPASLIDGDVLLMGNVIAATAAGIMATSASRLARPVLVAAGKGLYFRNGGTTAAQYPYRKVIYTVL